MHLCTNKLIIMTQSLPPKSIVLYADDDQDDLELIQEAFKDYYQNIDLITFEDGIALLNYIEQLTPLQPMPCLVILDVNMPGLDGKKTLVHLRTIEEFKEVPAVLFSTSTLPSEMAFAKQFNAGFVTKPLHTPQIALIVQKLLDHCTDEVKKRIGIQKGI